jgi:hypothetical protein
MLPKIMKWVSIAALLLALLWPSSLGYPMLLLGFAFCAGAILAAQASRSGKCFWAAAHTTISRKVKNEN